MKFREINGVSFYIFPSFEKTGLVRHCFTTRIGGVSTGCYSSLNLWRNHGDDEASVIENYRRICGAVGFSIENLVLSDQVHETTIYCPNEADRGKGLIQPSDIHRTDGFVTDRPGVVMTTFYADCVPLFFLDPVKKIVGLAHAGWKGAVQEIGAKTVQEMHRRFGCRYQDILAGIGPSIGPCCFEVDRPVVDAFLDALPFSTEYIQPAPYTSDNSAENPAEPSRDNSKYTIDLWAINAQSLQSVGISNEHIETADLCTKCNPTLFYSHRNMGTNRGAMAAMLELVGEYI